MPDTVNMPSGIGGNFRRYKQIVIAYGVMLLYYIIITSYMYNNFRAIPDYSNNTVYEIIFDMSDWVHYYVVSLLFILLYGVGIVLLLAGRFGKSVVVLPFVNFVWLILLLILLYVYAGKDPLFGMSVALWLIFHGVELLLALIVSAIVSKSYKRVVGLQELREASDGS